MTTPQFGDVITCFDTKLVLLQFECKNRVSLTRINKTFEKQSAHLNQDSQTKKVTFLEANVIWS